MTILNQINVSQFLYLSVIESFSVKSTPGCKVSPLVWSIFVGQNVDLTSGPHCIITLTNIKHHLWRNLKSAGSDRRDGERIQEAPLQGRRAGGEPEIRKGHGRTDRRGTVRTFSTKFRIYFGNILQLYSIRCVR